MDKLTEYRRIVCDRLTTLATEDLYAQIIFDLERDSYLGGFQESIYPMHVLGIWGGAMVHHPALRAPLHRRGILWVW